MVTAIVTETAIVTVTVIVMVYLDIHHLTPTATLIVTVMKYIRDPLNWV